MTKYGTQELFRRKIAEAESLPEYREITNEMEEVLKSIPDMLVRMENVFGSSGKMSVRFEKRASNQKKR